MVFDGTKVEVGPGTLYAAPLGTTEPTSVTGAWPSGWVALGYTDNGSTFAAAPTTANVEVEEELDPIKVVSVGRVITMAFSLAESTAKNAAIAFNAGVGTVAGGTLTGLVSGVITANPDGSLDIEPPVLGQEVRIMLGWDMLPEAASTGPDFERLVLRQCFQTGTISRVRQKGNNKALFTCTFGLEKPAGAQPFKMIFPAARVG